MDLRDIHHIRYRRYGFSVNDNFLSAEPKTNAAINYCIQSPKNINGSLEEFYTPLIDLRLSPEKIKEDIYHRSVSEIKSFISNQVFEYHLTTEISDKDLQAYIQAFNKFASTKKIRKAEGFRLRAYLRENILAVSFIKQNNSMLCLNLYRVTKERAVNLYSFTVPSALKNFNNSHLGRAHRSLHWLDIIEFKTKGVAYYDFCGWYPGKEDEALLNINKFKEQFTKNIVKEYTGVIYNNHFLLLLQKLRK